ncbi:LPD7 domain-containing protein (plasmid) [Xanthomonas campestris pv. olitorii]|nr:LPD7 domain-containing protein [Xanthomonas campestris pv. olitorii]
MSAESEALMQQFRKVVYERLVNPGKRSQLSPEGAIEQRSVAFRDWRIATQNANESVELAPDFVRHWAVADLTSWREMPGDRHDLAAEDIFQNLSANVSYAEILQTIDAGMVDSVKSLVAENERRSAEKEARKAREFEDSRAALLAEQQAALRIVESFKDSGQIPDEEWMQVGRAVDHVYLGGDRADLGAALELASAMARVDTSRPCPFPEGPVQRAFEGERAYQASKGTPNYEQVIDDLALRAGNEGDPAPRYVLERRQAVEHYALRLELRIKTLRAAGADAFTLRETQERLAVAHARAKELADDAPAATETETKRAEQEASVQAESEKAPPVPAAEPQVPLSEAAKSTAVEEADGFAGGVAADAGDKPFDPELVISKLLESVTYKAQKDGSVLYMVSERPAFIDHGQQIVMADKANEDEEAILAAVLLAKEKYGSAFELTGSEAFQRRAIEIMLKHKVDVTLKNPQQDALRRELANAKPDASEKQEAAKTEAPQLRIGKPAAEEASTDATHVSSASGDAPEEAPQGRLAADLVPVRALDWWTVQREAIHVWAKTDVELRADLNDLGPQPSSDLVYWFDKAGKPCEAPADAGAYLTSINPEVPGFADGFQSELRARVAMSSAVSRAEVISDINLKELTMTNYESCNQGQEPKLILRGVRKLDNGDFDTTALLFKGKGDYLQGFIKVGDEKRQVIAHINERKADQETGEIKPNFLKLSEPHGSGDDTSWKEIGFGNAVNRRSDGKPIYFDEVLFSVGSEVVKARITKNVDDELHRKLGFQEPRQARSKDDAKRDAAPGDASPKPTAPAAKPKEDAAGAPKARRSSRAKA